MTLWRHDYLTGVRVLDLTRVLAGPLCTMLLGDLGADVIKIERPDTGDDSRSWGPPFDQSGQSAYFLSVNRNKWSVAADLDTVDGQALVRDLVAGADVVVENFRPHMLERRNLGTHELLAQHPRLVWCTISGFGSESARIAYDFVVQAEQGWMAITGEPDGTPSKIGVALADVVAGKDAAVAVLAALFGRDRVPLSPKPATSPFPWRTARRLRSSTSPRTRWSASRTPSGGAMPTPTWSPMSSSMPPTARSRSPSAPTRNGGRALACSISNH